MAEKNTMKTREIGEYIIAAMGDCWLEKEYSNNGIQVEASEEADCVAFAVDACQETIDKAIALGAQMLVVHHGISWGNGFARIDGVIASRIGAMFKGGLTLFGCHLPLDGHPVLGNNAVIAKRLGFEVTSQFCQCHGMNIGAVCALPKPIQFAELLSLATERISSNTAGYDFSKDGMISSIGIISGSGDSGIDDCARLGIDCLLTGEFNHAEFHNAKESRVSMLQCGHYDTERTGIQELMNQVGKDLKVKTVFIEAPTGL